MSELGQRLLRAARKGTHAGDGAINITALKKEVEFQKDQAVKGFAERLKREVEAIAHQGNFQEIPGYLWEEAIDQLLERQDG